MSSTLEKNKSNHIRYLRKEIGNGDIDLDIKKELKTNRKKKVQNQLKNMEKPMKKFENELQKKAQRRPQSTRNQNFDKKLKRDLRKVNENQRRLNQKLRNVPYCNKKNPNNFFSKQKRLPNTIQEIDENEELARLLLKNPDKMTTEEKVYIASFNDREFKLFIDYLKMNKKAKEYNDDRKRAKNGNLFKEENGLTGDNMGNAEKEYNFEKNTRELMKQLEMYKNIMDQQKREIENQKYDSQVEAVNNVLDAQKNQLKNDIDNLQELKDKKYDLDDLYQKYITDYELNK